VVSTSLSATVQSPFPPLFFPQPRALSPHLPFAPPPLISNLHRSGKTGPLLPLVHLNFRPQSCRVTNFWSMYFLPFQIVWRPPLDVDPIPLSHFPPRPAVFPLILDAPPRLRPGDLGLSARRTYKEYPSWPLFSVNRIGFSPPLLSPTLLFSLLNSRTHWSALQASGSVPRTFLVIVAYHFALSRRV